jgi:hypothetical protein
MNGVLAKVLRPGWKTSEFWVTAVTLAGVLAPALIPRADSAVGSATTALSQHGTTGAIAAGAVAGAYSIARAIVKAKASEMAPVTDPDVVPFGGK